MSFHAFVNVDLDKLSMVGGRDKELNEMHP